ncbi:MAG TPA: hypothetical protein VKE74_03535 [Gemmataceae bacterium]|nr:hypothetical protein [Gemmataceae bacterium]
MKTPVCAAAIALGLTAVVLGLAGARADQPGVPKEPVVPDEAFRAIVKEANHFIQEPLTKARTASPKPADASGYYGSARSNALLIALAAQNRMRDGRADAGRLATLRDAAVRLADVVQNNPRNLTEIVQLADLLNSYPDLKADPNARSGRVRLKDTFTHDDITFLFGGCSGRSGHAIQSDLLALSRQRSFTLAEVTKIERLGYKVALLAELVREFAPTFVSPNKPGRQEEWVRLADIVQQGGWDLAATVRDADFTEMKQGLGTLYSACATCHVLFRN